MAQVSNSSENDSNKLDLSGQNLRRLINHPMLDGCKNKTSLVLDRNDLQKLENLDKFPSAALLSARHNVIARMYPVSKLRNLVFIDLSYNNIPTIEGLRDLVNLKQLILSCNRIKVIDKLQNNTQLEELDLSENAITSLSNISDLTKLKKLNLSKNAIANLRHAEVYLPPSLESLQLAANKLNDLAEISRLKNLSNLKEISIVSNPCVEMTGDSPGFDYRPYIANWCVNVKLIDGFLVDDIESLKAEWLYSQGRGRKFKPGQHAELIQYLIETCPLNSQSLLAEDERKLRLILSKAHHHQRQLKLAEQPGTSTDKNIVGELMTRSLDPTLLECCSFQEGGLSHIEEKTEVLSRSLCEPVGFSSDETGSKGVTRAPLPAATKLVPVPESLVSPMVTMLPPLPSTSDTSRDQVSAEKLLVIRNVAQIKRDKKYDASNKEQAAICIQKTWRGYYARNHDPRVISMYQTLNIQRTHSYIKKLSEDMSLTRSALDNDHRLQLLQMQAMNALWKKVQDMQQCMNQVLTLLSPTSAIDAGTQTVTESPISDPNILNRPSSLLLQSTQATNNGDNNISDAVERPRNDETKSET